MSFYKKKQRYIAKNRFHKEDSQVESSKIFSLVRIHTQEMDHYALRDSLENAQEEVFCMLKEVDYTNFRVLSRQVYAEYRHTTTL